MSATIRNPTTETLKNLTRGASDAIKSHPGTILQNVTAALGLSDCSDVEGRLQDSAVHDAAARAQRLAHAANVTLGAPTIITPAGLPGYAFPCRTSRTIPRFFVAESAFPLDGNVDFGLLVDVTYPIINKSSKSPSAAKL